MERDLVPLLTLPLEKVLEVSLETQEIAEAKA